MEKGGHVSTDAVRFATIGTSGICERFLDALKQTPETKLAAVYSRDPERARAFAAAHGATYAMSDLDELAACSEVDAVYVASPIALHAPQACELIAGGKHVLVEKSFASNEREAAGVFDAAHKAGVVAMEAMRSLHVPTFSLIERTMPELGALHSAAFRFSKVSSRMARLVAGERLNVFDPCLSEGALMDIGIYCVELAVALLGTPKDVCALAVTTRVPGEPAGSPYALIDLSGEVLLSYDGLVAGLSYGKTSDDELASELAGERATLVWDQTSCPRELTLHIHEDQGLIFGTSQGAVSSLKADVPKNDMVCELSRFCAAVQGDSEALAAVQRFEKVTRVSVGITDEVRRQIGIRFPADE